MIKLLALFKFIFHTESFLGKWKKNVSLRSFCGELEMSMKEILLIVDRVETKMKNLRKIFIF